MDKPCSECGWHLIEDKNGKHCSYCFLARESVSWMSKDDVIKELYSKLCSKKDNIEHNS